MPLPKQCRSTCHSIAINGVMEGKDKIFVNVKDRRMDRLVMKRIEEKSLIQYDKKIKNRPNYICRQCIEFITNVTTYKRIPYPAHQEKKLKKETRGRPRKGTYYENTSTDN